MPVDEPDWWYGPESSAKVRYLRPLELLYARQAVRRLNRPHQPYRSRLPVICVGNFTAGGTGKTPLTLHLVDRLTAMGERPVILTRGYGGQLKGPHWVDATGDWARDVGDEPLLLARSAPTLISRDRRAGAIAIEASPMDFSVIIMDDGLQNPAIAKDLTLAIIDARRGLGNGHVIPAGPLRAPLDAQLPLTDAIVLNGPPVSPPPELPIGGDVDANAGENAGATPSRGADISGTDDVTSARLATLRREFPGPVLAAHAEAVGDLSWLTAQPIVAFAGIANPDRFFSLVERCGGRIAERLTFKDHHSFSEDDARRLLGIAAAAGATLVTTEKDHVRLRGPSEVVGQLAQAARTLPIRLVIEEADRQRADALLAGALTPDRLKPYR